MNGRVSLHVSPIVRLRVSDDRPAVRRRRIAPDGAGFDAAVRAYDQANPIRHPAVRSSAVDALWVKNQLKKRRAYLLKVAASFGLGTAALAMDPLDNQLDTIDGATRDLDRLNATVLPSLKRRMAIA